MYRIRLQIVTCLSAVALAAIASRAIADEKFVHEFERQQLTDVYYSEGANAGDIDGDGKPDVVYGPYWYAGPDFKKKFELYPPKGQNREGYADNFFNWVYDFNGDGRNDVFVVGFPGTPAYVYENPGAGSFDKHWKKHAVFESVANESPHFTNIVGDDRPELICTYKGGFGFATIDGNKPFEPWKFHTVSDQAAPDRFGHGLGVGDINGDGRNDIICVTGWFEQPRENATSSPWPFHPAKFSNAYGGAEMYAYDVDGDGDNDVITSLAAHDFGLAWFENYKNGDQIAFRQHLIMGDKPTQNRYGLVFSELHSLALADIDGDGLKDIVTGKTFYSHHKGSPMWDAGAVVYWFRLTRNEKGVDWIPYRADTDAGIGRQVSIVDVNGDRLPDIVLGGMVGAHVLTHHKKAVSDAEWKEAQPKLIPNFEEPAVRGAAAVFNDARKVADAVEGEELKVLKVSAGRADVQDMNGFPGDRWSGDKQLFWMQGKPGATLELEFSAAETKTFDIVGAFTMARDYAVIDVALDGQVLKKDLDLFNSDVANSGELSLGQRKLDAGPHKLVLTITGSNPSAVKAYMVGFDYLRLKPAK